MKKMLWITLILVLVLCLGATSAVAAAPPQGQGANFCDANNDGLCDICAAAACHGDGVCDVCPNNGTRPQDGRGHCGGQWAAHQGSAFVDADGDGVCDNRPNCGARGQRCGWNK